MTAHYEIRNAYASRNTESVMAPFACPMHNATVLSKAELLSAVEKRAESRAEIARVLNLAPARITEMMKGDRDLSFDEARKLIKRYRIEDESGPRKEASLSELADEVGITLVQEIDLAYGMGAGTFVDQAVETRGLVPFKTEWLRGMYSGSASSLVVARGEGDSMQPTILDGDLVLIDRSQASIRSQDRIWAVTYGELGMIKRVRRTPAGNYLLMSDNPSVSPVEAVDGEMHVIGRVIWIGRRM